MTVTNALAYFDTELIGRARSLPLKSGPVKGILSYQTRAEMTNTPSLLCYGADQDRKSFVVQDPDIFLAQISNLNEK